jgi:hypothetical protein
MQHYIPQKHGFRYVIVCSSTLHKGGWGEYNDINNSTHGVEKGMELPLSND